MCISNAMFHGNGGELRSQGYTACVFLHDLHSDQRSPLLTMASRMMSADAVLHDMELAILTQLREEMALPMSWRPQSGTLDELLSHFTTPRHQAIVVLSLLRVARADRQLAPEERGMIQHVVRSFNMPHQTVRDLARWLSQYHALLDEGNTLLG